MDNSATIAGPVTLMSLTLQFLLELGALAALAYWGYSTGGGEATHVVLAVAAPAVAATAWGLFGAPKAPFHLTGSLRLLLQATFFGSAAIALDAAGRRWPALIFALVVAANVAILNARDRG